MNAYVLIMAFAGVIILSFFFNIIAKKTKIPSVLMLIGLGVGIKAILQQMHIMTESSKLNTALEVIGNVGLVMIVLEAALDLELKKEKRGLIFRSFVIALLGIGASMAGLATFFMYIFPGSDWYQAFLYSIPLSIMSSAIIIPSVGQLTGKKKEFIVYESTFSDILGIMVFNFMLSAETAAPGESVGWGIFLNVSETIVLSVIISYLLVYLFQKLTMQVKLFLIISVLILLFAIGKYLHLSALLLILTFGLVLNNSDLFFQGFLKKHFNKELVKPIIHDFHTLTLESAFVIRTIFFVLFGLSITLSSFYNFEVAMNSLAIVGILYVVRYILLQIFGRKHIWPELFIAPRGLITVLLYFVLQKHNSVHIPLFDPGLLLYPILITSIIMMFALISYRGEKVVDVLRENIPLIGAFGDNKNNPASENESNSENENPTHK